MSHLKKSSLLFDNKYIIIKQRTFTLDSDQKQDFLSSGLTPFNTNPLAPDLESVHHKEKTNISF